MWQSQVSDRRKNYFEAVTGKDIGHPECQGGYPIPKATPKRCVSRVKSQPKLRLSLKRRESRVYKTWLSLIPILGYFLISKLQAVKGLSRNYGVLAKRNPKLLSRPVGVLTPRLGERAADPSLTKDPPRKTRRFPHPRPLGSVAAPAE